MAKEALITLANGHQVKIDLFDQDAPNTVTNFEKLANEEFYDKLAFHRIIPGFVAQGGCPHSDSRNKPKYTINCEINHNKHEHDSLSIAHAGPNTKNSQFFIVYQPQPHLDDVHTVFGKVSEGMKHVDNFKGQDRMESIRVSP